MRVSAISRGRWGKAVRRWGSFSVLALSGCAGGSRGCTADTAPVSTSVPRAQQIGGGVQVRIPKTGLDKIMAEFKGAIPVGCLSQQTVVDTPPVLSLVACDSNDCPGGKQGCPIYAYQSSKLRPSPSNLGPPFPPPAANDDDGKDGISYSITSATAIGLDAKIDVFVPVHVSQLSSVVGNSTCYLDAYTTHIGDDTAAPLDITGTVTIGTDPSTGEAQFSIGNIKDTNLSVTTAGCPVISDLSPLIGLVNSTVGSYIVDAVTPALNDQLAALIPNPPGGQLALDLSALAPYSPPAGTELDFTAIAGGYVNTARNGVDLGVIAGANGIAKQQDGGIIGPASCASGIAAPDLASAPYSLPLSKTGFFNLAPAAAFEGSPDPKVGTASADVAFGVSRAFLTFTGTQAVRSGAFCLTLGGANLPSLTTGSLSVLVDSTGTLYTDRHAPLLATLQPTNGVVAQIGAGTADDPFLHASTTGLGIDFHLDGSATPALSVTLDLAAAFDVGSTPVTADHVGVEPLLVSSSVSNVAVTHVDSAALSADPDRLTKFVASFGDALAGILAGRFGGPAPMPSVANFTLDQLTLSKVTSTADSFLSIAALAGAATKGTAIDTTASIAAMDVPNEVALRTLYDPSPSTTVPTVTVTVGPANAEFSYRLDGSAWHAWSASAPLVISDSALRLQGHHSLDVKARTPGKWRTEDLTPAHVDFVVDSVPPELHPSVDSTKTTLSFGGFDLVTLDANLVYAWNDASGQQTPFGATSSMSVSDALALTAGGTKPLVLLAKDEAGNVGSVSVDVNALLAGGTGVIPDGGAIASGGSGSGAGGTAGTGPGGRDGGHLSFSGAGGGSGGPASGTGTGGAGAGMSADASAGDASKNAGASEGDSSGCGCRTAPAKPSSAWLVAAAAIAVGARRRRNRRNRSRDRA